MKTARYDTIIIGAGQSGSLACALGKAGRRTALIERAQVGGTCVNRGCTPSKTMAASARVAHLARRAAEFGVRVGDVSMDMARVYERTWSLAHEFHDEVLEKLQGAPGVELMSGEARFIGPKSVEVCSGGERRVLAAETIIINTGTRNAVPPLEGLGDVPFLDSTSVMQLRELPSHLIVLGGGVIALEFGQMFRHFGARVTVVEQARQLLEREDADVAQALTQILREDGIEVLTATEAMRVRKTGDGIELTVCAANDKVENKQAPEKEKTLRGSHLLVATGRTPNTDALNAEAAGVLLDEKGFVRVSEQLQTDVPGIYAMGDVTGGPAFTHIAFDDGRILRANLLQGAQRSTRDRLVPYVVYTDPQLGRVGMSEQEAGQAGHNVRVAVLPMNETARGLETGESRGLLKAVVDADNEQILGAAVLSLEGGEVMAALQMAMQGGLPYTALRDGVFAHPSLAESFNILFKKLDS